MYSFTDYEIKSQMNDEISSSDFTQTELHLHKILIWSSKYSNILPAPNFSFIIDMQKD